tara:strand:+ start:1182 stop:1598 length:417 start_codon:yes stop_codon:yes gene_type:complete
MFAGLTATPALAQTSDLDWMSGHWRAESDGRISEEIWSHQEGNSLLGYVRYIRDGNTTGFEFLRIMTGDTTVYYAQPGGQPPTAFTLTDSGVDMAVFENAEHDFPQRLRYERFGDALTITISDMDESRMQVWTYERVE